jgi:hypothetical protein
MVASETSTIMIIVNISCSRVCEMSRMLAFASASRPDTRAMMPTRSWPMTVTMTRLLAVGIRYYAHAPRSFIR